MLQMYVFKIKETNKSLIYFQRIVFFFVLYSKFSIFVYLDNCFYFPRAAFFRYAGIEKYYIFVPLYN